MSSWLASAVAISFLKKRESVLEPYRRVIEQADEEQKKAVNELETATKELVRVVSEKVPNAN